MRKLLLALLFLLPALAQAAAPSISVAASRTSCTAPCYIHFDATGTTDADTTKPFHDLLYQWSFGDTSAGNWGNGANTSLPKNGAFGPVAAHLYETAGTFTVTLQVGDGTNTVKNSSITITVASANTTFSATTVCIAASTLPVAGSGGCPSGAAVATNSDFAAECATQLAAGKKRLLWKRGDTFTYSTFCGINTASSVGLMGVYGTGAKPTLVCSGTADYVFRVSTSSIHSGLDDWRFMDFNAVGCAGFYTGFIHAEGTASQLTILRNDLSGFGMGVDLADTVLDNHNRTGNGTHVVWDQIGVFDNTWVLPYNTNSYPVFMGAERSAIMGNNFNNANGATQGAHVIRAGYFAKNVVSNNTLASPSGAQSNEVGKFHGPVWRTFTGTTHTTTTIDGIWNTTGYVAGETITGTGIQANTKIFSVPTSTSIVLDKAATASATVTLTLGDSVGTAGLGAGYSRWLIFSDNRVIADTSVFAIAVQATNDSIDERIKDVIYERNYTTAGPTFQYGFIVTATEVTARNNVIDMTASVEGSGGAGRCFLVYQPGNDANHNNLVPDNVWLYNNTCYTSATFGSAKVALAVLGSTAGTPVQPNHVTVKNNLLYAPNTTTPLLLNDSGTTNLTRSNNTTDSTDAAGDGTTKTSPLFDSVLTWAGFRPSATSPIKNSGTPVFPSVYDAFGCKSKSGNVRLGAFVPKTEAQCKSVP